MERIQQIWAHPLYQDQYQKLQQAERDRIFCKHDLTHFLDVARLAYLYRLEEGNPVSKVLIYAAALLHDLGRYEQLTAGTPHEAASAGLAGRIMPDCGFDSESVLAVQTAILQHRQNPRTAESRLAAYLYRADKQSRCCFACPAAGECRWEPEKRNMRISL